jgi:tetratricopeptide (TPR) repeat protein
MVKLILVLFLTLPIFLFSKNVHLEKGIDYCKKGNIDSALYHLNVIGDEVTIETSLEDIFNKNYYTAKCYDHIEANKSAEYYYLKAIAIMDSAEFSNTEIYLDLANFYQRIRNYISSNEYLKRYYEIEMGRLGQEAMTASENEKRIDSLETTITEMASNKKKLESDIRLLIVLITVFGLAFLVSLFLNIRNRNKTGKKS